MKARAESASKRPDANGGCDLADFAPGFCEEVAKNATFFPIPCSPSPASIPLEFKISFIFRVVEH